MTYLNLNPGPDHSRKVIAIGIILLLLILAICRVARGEVTPLAIAQSQIGSGEVGGNNKGAYVREYLNGREDLPWCAGFISYCVRKAEVDMPYLLQAKSYLKYGKRINNPRAGDFIIFGRKGGGHIGIIEKVTQDTLTTIEGNVGNAPAVVRRFEYKLNDIPNLLGFVRITKNN